MARTSWRKDTETDMGPATPDPFNTDCQICVKTEATNTRDGSSKRLEHYIQFAADYGTDALRTHLTTYMQAWYSGDSGKAKEAVHSHLGWVWDQMNTYGGLVDDQTGATLSWYDGRKQALAAIRDYYARTSEAARAKSEAAETSAWPTENPARGLPA